MEAQRRIFYGAVKGNEGSRLTNHEVENLTDCLDVAKAHIFPLEEFASNVKQVYPKQETAL